MNCPKQKIEYCDKVQNKVNPLFCEKECRGNWQYQRKIIAKAKQGYADGNKYRQICRDCENYRRSCKTGEFCLLLTRNAEPKLSDRWLCGECPVDKWSSRPQPTDNKAELVSVIVLARNEPYLKPTLENLIERADGPIEIICVLDGPTEYPILKHELVTYIRHDTPHGRRPSTNEACRAAKGKYLFHVDGHVLTNSQGWDILFKAACKDNKTMVIPNLDKLLVDDWRAKGRRMGHKYVSVKMKDCWSGYKNVERVEQTITGNGMGWFLPTDYYWALGGCNESYGVTWGNFGLEWAMKVWLSDPDGRGPGQVLLHRDVVFAHMWKKSLGYKTPDASAGRNNLWQWVEGTGPNQVRDFAYFEENLGHLLPPREDDKAPIFINRVTAIMNTNGLYPELIEEAVESFLRQDYPHKHLNIICTHPDGLELNKEYDNITVFNIEPPKRFPDQIAYAIRTVETPYWCVFDSDDIFAANHISQLVEGLKKAKAENTQSPFYVKVPKALEQRGERLKERGPGWWCCLYEKMTVDAINLALDKHKKKFPDQHNSFDLIIRGLRQWNQYVYRDAEPTVLHRLGVASHIGFAKHDPDRYETLLAEAEKTTLPVLKPQFYGEYFNMQSGRVVNIYSKNHLGDAVCMEPAIRHYKKRNPEVNIRLFTKWPQLFVNNPNINESLHIDQCDQIDHQLTIHKRTHLTTWLAQDMGFDMDHSDLLPNIYYPGKPVEIEIKKPFVLFSIRTRAVSKRWAKESWVEVVEWCKKSGFTTVQVGQKERNIHCDINLVNKTSIDELLWLTRQAEMTVSIDHGLPHIAAAVKTPAVVLFGPGMPIEAEHKGLTYPVETNVCRECRYKSRIDKKCPKVDAMCMFSITPDMVTNTIARVSALNGRYLGVA